MKRVFTATCVAAMCAVGLSAQSTGTAGTTGQDPQTGGGQGRGGPRTITGCLRAGDTAGTYMLTDVTGLGGGRGQGGGGGTTAGGGTTTGGGGTTAGGGGGTTGGGGGTTAGGGATTAGGGQGRGMPTSIMLTADSSVDLKAHVGHKIEVTGTMAGGRGQGGGAGTTAGGTGTTAGGTTTGTATGTATGTGTTGGGTGAGATGGGQGGGRGRSMTVTNVRMVSESCS